MAYNPAQAQSLVDLARHQAPEDRAQLFNRVADLFQVSAQTANQNEHALLLEIMRALSAQVDVELRLSLAERLADHPEADHDLIRMLAHDKIEVATPIILKSVVLTEYDLVEIVRECSIAHCTTVAKRPAIPEVVADALIERDTPDVFRALAGNPTARIGVSALERLVAASREDKTLLTNLVTRHKLPQAMAVRMYAWASAALRKHILENYKIDPKLLDEEMAHAVSNELTRDLADPHTKRLQDLVDKLSQSGQLKPGFLLKALREGQIDLFRLAFARLIGLAPERMSIMLAAGDLRTMALAVRAVGIDRSAFPTIIQKLHGKTVYEEIDPAVRATVVEALAITSQDLARAELSAALTNAA